MDTLGDNGKPPESELAVADVVYADQQQEPSPPVTSAEHSTLLLDEPDVVCPGVGSGVAVGRERSVTEEFSRGFLGVGKQRQHLRPLQQLNSSSISSSQSLGGGV